MLLNQREFEESIIQNVMLAPMTTLGIGGPARYYSEVASTDAVIAGVAWAHARGLPLFVLGGGSNIVVADRGFRGLVLRVSIRGIETRIDDRNVMLTAGAGEEWDLLVAHCISQNWAGFECLSGIPGRVGATPIQNVGAYGQETSETLASVEVLDLDAGSLVVLQAGDCEFGYRTSRFKIRDRGRFVITRVTYKLNIDGDPAMRYPELQRYIADSGIDSPALSEVREAVLTLRRRKAMVIDSQDADSRSVGSFFVNPTITTDEFEQLKHRGNAADLPVFPVSDNRVKLSAAWLIENSGIKRGHIHKNVGISGKHALAIINRGGGSSGEIVELMKSIQKRVVENFGIDLTPEPIFVGFDE